MMENPSVAVGREDRVAMTMPNIVMKYEMKAAGLLVCAFIAFLNIEASIKLLALRLFTVSVSG